MPYSSLIGDILDVRNKELLYFYIFGIMSILSIFSIMCLYDAKDKGSLTNGCIVMLDAHWVQV